MEDLGSLAAKGAAATEEDRMKAIAIGRHLNKEGALDAPALGLIRQAFHAGDGGDGANDGAYLSAVNEIRQSDFGKFQKRLAPIFASMGKDGDRGLLSMQGTGDGQMAVGAETEAALRNMSADDWVSMDVDGRKAAMAMRTTDGRTIRDIIPEAVKERMAAPVIAGRLKQDFIDAAGIKLPGGGSGGSGSSTP